MVSGSYGVEVSVSEGRVEEDSSLNKWESMDDEDGPSERRSDSLILELESERTGEPARAGA